MAGQSPHGQHLFDKTTLSNDELFGDARAQNGETGIHNKLRKKYSKEKYKIEEIGVCFASVRYSLMSKS